MLLLLLSSPAAAVTETKGTATVSDAARNQAAVSDTAIATAEVSDA